MPTDDEAGKEAGKWWERVGYSSEEEFWKAQLESERAWDVMLGNRRPPAPRLPPTAASERAGPRRLRHRQVNVKLADDEHGALREAARAYGVRPATMARLLVVRGLKAVADEDRRERSS